MVLLVISGIWLLVSPHDLEPVSNTCIATISLIALGIDRSWELLGGRPTGLSTLITRRLAHTDAQITPRITTSSPSTELGRTNPPAEPEPVTGQVTTNP
jgi:hypothetical protein